MVLTGIAGCCARAANGHATAARRAGKIPRRHCLHLVADAAGIFAVSRIASAQTYPTRPSAVQRFKLCRTTEIALGDDLYEGW
jgi:hypothetical protein